MSKVAVVYGTSNTANMLSKQTTGFHPYIYTKIRAYKYEHQPQPPKDGARNNCP